MGEDAPPCRVSHVSCGGVCTVVEREVLERLAVLERHAMMQGHVEEFGWILAEAVEGLHSLEEQDAACERPDVCRKHDVSWGADDLWRSVGCCASTARVLVVVV